MVWKKLDQGNSVYGMKIWIEALSLATSLSFRLQPCSLLLLRICVSPNAHVECFIDAPVRKLENLSEVLAVMFNSQAPCCQALSRDPGEDILWLLLALDSTLLQLAHQHDSYRSLCSYVLVDETQFWVCTSQELHSSSPAGQFNNCSEVDNVKVSTMISTLLPCNAPVKSSPPTNQHSFFYRPDALPVSQPTVSKHWREKYHIPWTCLPQAHLWVFQLCVWPLTAPGYLGGGLPCNPCNQPSDASTP